MTQGEAAGLFFGWLIVLVIWILVSHAIGKAAERRGRTYWAFFWLSLLASPLIMGMIVATLPMNEPAERHHAASTGRITVISDKTECPHCAEEVKVKAMVCKHCGRDIGDDLKELREEYLRRISEIEVGQSTGKGPVFIVDGECPVCGGQETAETQFEGQRVLICPTCSFQWVRQQLL